jgi:hypothetical protein
MHRAALNGLKMVGNKLSAKEEEAYHKKGPINQDHHAVTEVLGTEVEVDDLGRHHLDDTVVQRTKESDDPELPTERMTTKTMKRRWGRHALPGRFASRQYPKVLNYLMINKKYDGSQEPQSWLSDYLQAVKLLGGTNETAMQSLQLHLTGAARSWLSKLEKETIGSWEELTKQFTSNFKSTYKRPASIEEVKACVQQRGETLKTYIQRWSLIKNSAVEVSDERAIDAFIIGLRRGDLVEEMGRIKPKTVSDLMDVANRFADGEDACNNKRTRSPEDDRGNRYGGQRRRSRNYDNYGSHSQVAAGYKDNSYQGNDRKSLGYRNYGREEYKKFPPRESREYNPSPEDMLNGPCHIHSAFIDGKRVSRHAMKDCTTFLKLQEAALNKQAEAKRQGYEGNTSNMPATQQGNSGAPKGQDQSNQGCDDEEGYVPSKGHITAMIQPVPKSNKEEKSITRQVNLAITSPPVTTEYLHWSEQPIEFSKDDHPITVPRPGNAPLVLKAQIGRYDVGRIFMDA